MMWWWTVSALWNLSKWFSGQKWIRILRKESWAFFLLLHPNPSEWRKISDSCWNGKEHTDFWLNFESKCWMWCGSSKHYSFFFHEFHEEHGCQAEICLKHDRCCCCYFVPKRNERPCKKNETKRGNRAENASCEWVSSQSELVCIPLVFFEKCPLIQW